MAATARELVREKLIRDLRQAQRLLDRKLEARRRSLSGAVSTDSPEIDRFLESDPSIAGSIGTSFVRNTARLPSTITGLAGLATFPFIPGEEPQEGAGALGTIGATTGLSRASRAAEALDKVRGPAALTMGLLPGLLNINEPTRGAVEGAAEGNLEALRGDDPGLARRFGVGALDLFSSPIELAPGGVVSGTLRLVKAGAGLAAAGALVGAVGVARKIKRATDLTDLTRLAGEGLTRGAVEEGLARSDVMARGQLKALEAGAAAARAEAMRHVQQVADRSRRVADDMVNFPFAPTSVQRGAKGQERALETALELAKAKRRFAPTLQTAGPRAGGQFAQRPGGPTTEPFNQIQSQLARDPVAGVSVGGGLPESFAGQRVEAAVVPLSGAKMTTSMKAAMKDLAQGPDDLAKRADELLAAEKKAPRFPVDAEGRVLPRPGVQRTIPVAPALQESFDAQTGVLLRARQWQAQIANLWLMDRTVGRQIAVQRGEEILATVKRIARDPSAVRTYGPLSRATKRAGRTTRSVDELIDTDMLVWAEGTGNPRLGPADTLAMVEARLESLPGWDRLKKQAKLFRDEMNAKRIDANELNSTIGLDDIPYRDNYVHHRWASPKLFRNWFSEKGRAAAKAKGSEEFQRSFPTYREGMFQGGLEPVSLRFSDNVIVSNSEYAQNLAAKRALQQMAAVNVVEDGSPLGAAAFVRAKGALPKGYVKIENAELSRAIGGNAFSEPNIGVHKSMAPVVRNLLTEHSFNAFDELIAGAKMGNLAMSTFHQFTLGAESAPALLGPLHGLAVSARLGFGLPAGIAPNNLAKTRAGLQALLESAQRSGRIQQSALRNLGGSSLVDEAVAASSRAGVTGTPSIDVIRGTWEKVAGDLSRAVRKVPLVGEGAASLNDVAITMQRSINKGLWDGFHNPIKHYAFSVLNDGLLQVKRGAWSPAQPIRRWQQGRLKKVSDESIARDVARIVNDEFGGQFWEGNVGKFADWLVKHTDKAPVEWANTMRRWMLSPDWLISSVRMGTAPVMGGLMNNPVQLILGARHWKNFALGAAMYANMTNFAFTKIADARERKVPLSQGEGKFIFNDPLARSFFHIRSPFRSEKTKEIIYLRWGKQFQETKPFVKAAQGLVTRSGGGLEETRDILLRKMNPIVAAGLALAMPPEDFPTLVQKAEGKALDEGRELTDPEVVMWSALHLASEGLLPFSFRESGIPFGPVPQALGVDLQDAQFDLADALERGDGQAAQAILFKLRESENLSPEAEQVIFNRAMNAVDRRQGLITDETEEERILRRRNPR